MLQTVVETPEFIKEAKKCMDLASKEEFISFIAANPLSGEIIPESGGVRKIRWSKDKNSGKRGGVRIIYFYLNRHIPIFLFTVYGKGNKINLSISECRELKIIVKQIAECYM